MPIDQPNRVQIRARLVSEPFTERQPSWSCFVGEFLLSLSQPFKLASRSRQRRFVRFPAKGARRRDWPMRAFGKSGCTIGAERLRTVPNKFLLSRSLVLFLRARSLRRSSLSAPLFVVCYPQVSSIALVAFVYIFRSRRVVFTLLFLRCGGASIRARLDMRMERVSAG